MITAGLTGSIASGKSSVCSVFERLGAAVVDADLIAKEIVKHGGDGWRSVVNSFGDEILLADGNIDRVKLGSFIFSDKKARAELDNCLHPLIISKLMSEVHELKKSAEYPVVIADVPLLIECGIQKDFDKLILVYSDRETQIKRLIKRNNLTLSEADQRVSSQMDIEEKRKFAHIIIDNCGSLEELEKSVREIYFTLT